MSNLTCRKLAAMVLVCSLGPALAYDVNPGNADDAATINAAITAAAAGSGRVTLADGTYNLQSPVLLNAAVELVGNDADRSCVIFDGAGKYRLLEVTHNDGFAHGITFRNGYSDKMDNWAHGPVYLTAGCVSNCVYKAGRGKYSGAVSLNPTANGAVARVTDLYIEDCTCSDTGGAGIGGGLRFIGNKPAIAERCVVTNCWGNNGYAVYINTASAQLLDSTICGGTKGGLNMNQDALVSNCVIRANAGRATGAGVTMAKGTLKHCLITENAASTSGGGIYMSGGTVDHCTVVGNAAATSGAGVHQTGGIIRNSIVWHNGSTTYLAHEGSLQAAGGTRTYTCAALAGAGTGNVTDRLPAFADVAHGDWALAAASPCRGAGEDGSDLGWRPYGASAAPRVSFTYAFVDGAAPAKTTFQAAVEGCTATGYSWDFGDGSAADTTSGATAEHAYAQAGRYTVRLTVQTAAGEQAYEVANAVTLGSSVTYADPNGTGTFPYATPQTACADIQAAIDAVIATEAKPGKVVLAASASPYLLGTHERFIVARPVEVVGAGPENTFVDCRQTSGKTGFLLQHEKAVVSSLRVYRGQWAAGYGGGGANVEAGTITNCVFDTCRGAYNGSVAVTGAKAALVDCTVRNGKHTDGGGAGTGGGVYLTAGLVSGCTVESCTGGSNGGGIYATGGTITNCVIRNCTITGGNGRAGGVYLTGSSTKACGIVVEGCQMTKNGGIGGGGVYIDGGTLTDAVVTNCATTYMPGGGVYMAGGTMARTVVAENSAATTGGGIQMTAGTLDHCTVARNNAMTDGSGVYMTGGTVKNSIVAGNGNLAGRSAAQLKSTAGAISYSCAAELAAGSNGNIAADPTFRAPEADDFRLMASSPCVGRAEDGGDMGAIPYVFDPTAEPTLAVTVQVDGNIHPVVATSAVSVEGQLPADVKEYVWTLGDGAVVTTNVAQVEHTYANCGIYDVSVLVVLTDGKTYGAEKLSAVPVYSDVAYVNASSANPVAPYDTREKAARTIGEALDMVYVGKKGYATVVVASGTYPLVANTEYIVTKDVRIVSESGARDVVIDGMNRKYGFHLDMRAAGAVASGLVVSNAQVYGQTWGVYDIRGGIVTNCMAFGCSGGYGGGGRATGEGKIVDCRFEQCSSNDSNGGGHHSLGGLLIENGGLVENCFITNCTGGANAGGLQIDGGVVRNTTVIGCTGSGRAFVMRGGLAENCRILRNTSSGSTGHCVGVFSEGGTLRNSLVAENTALSGGFVGIRVGTLDAQHVNSSVVENCTVAGNVGTHAGIIANEPQAVWRNCLSSANAGEQSLSAGTFTTCFTGEDAGFRNAARGDYRLRRSSAAIDAGTELDWMVKGSADLLGNPRVKGSAVDIGCFENTLSGCVIIVR